MGKRGGFTVNQSPNVLPQSQSQGYPISSSSSNPWMPWEDWQYKPAFFDGSQWLLMPSSGGYDSQAPDAATTTTTTPAPTTTTTTTTQAPAPAATQTPAPMPGPAPAPMNPYPSNSYHHPVEPWFPANQQFPSPFSPNGFYHNVFPDQFGFGMGGYGNQQANPMMPGMAPEPATTTTEAPTTTTTTTTVATQEPDMGNNDPWWQPWAPENPWYWPANQPWQSQSNPWVDGNNMNPAPSPNATPMPTEAPTTTTTTTAAPTAAPTMAPSMGGGSSGGGFNPYPSFNNFLPHAFPSLQLPWSDTPVMPWIPGGSGTGSGTGTGTGGVPDTTTTTTTEAPMPAPTQAPTPASYGARQGNAYQYNPYPWWVPAGVTPAPPTTTTTVEPTTTTTASTTTTTTTPAPDVGTNAPTGSGTSGSNGIQNSIYPSFNRPCLYGDIRAVQGSNTQFEVCHNKRWVVINCPKGTLFHSEINVCVHNVSQS